MGKNGTLSAKVLEEGITMKTVEAIYSGGVLKLLNPLAIPENQRVRLTIEPYDAASWVDAVKEFQQQVVANHGTLPDSTAEIAADRRRHE
jgi:predicted DNA-binding antitoxin AbrB/MazE fold protein